MTRQDSRVEEFVGWGVVAILFAILLWVVAPIYLIGTRFENPHVIDFDLRNETEGDRGKSLVAILSVATVFLYLIVGPPVVRRFRNFVILTKGLMILIAVAAGVGILLVDSEVAVMKCLLTITVAILMVFSAERCSRTLDPNQFWVLMFVSHLCLFLVLVCFKQTYYNSGANIAEVYCGVLMVYNLVITIASMSVLFCSQND